MTPRWTECAWKLDAKIEREVDGLRSEMQEGFARLDAKLDTKADNLDAKIDTKTDDLHAKLDAKIEREVSSLRSDLGGRIDANTQKLARTCHRSAGSPSHPPSYA